MVKFFPTNMDDFENRFGGLARLFGLAGGQRLRAARVCVVGLGGVGSWAAEALARSGVGALTLVDGDDICATNINRQLPALTETVGRAKVAVIVERIRAINPDCRVAAEQTFFNAQTSADLLAPPFDFVLDAIDHVANKVLLLAHCREKNLPVVASGGAGGRRDGTQIRTADLARVSHDRLLAAVRKQLRQDFGFPADGSALGIECVFSAETPGFAPPDGAVGGQRGGLGTAAFVTGAFGLAAAGLLVRKLAAPDRRPAGSAFPIGI